MGYSVVLGPTQEPLSLAEAKQHCRVDFTDDDGLIAGYILAARSLVETQIRRPIVSRLYSYTIDYCWPVRCSPVYAVSNIWIELPLPPLQAVRSISYVDGAGASQTLASNQYSVLTNRPVGVIVPAYGVTWPSIRAQHEAVTIRFVAGYTNFTDTTTSPNSTVTGPGIPDELRQAIQMLVGHWYENREAVSLGVIPYDLPLAVEALISPYRAVSL